MGAVVIAVLATIVIATMSTGGAAPSSASQTSIASSRLADASVPLGRVTVHALTPLPDVRRSSAGQVTEQVQMAVVGGPLSLTSDSAAVTLAPAGGRGGRTWTGSLPPVRVVDARGTHSGWQLRWSVSSIDVVDTQHRRVEAGATVRVDPSAPVVVDGLAEGLRAGTTAPASAAKRTLMRAEPGWGGGTYEAGGTVTVRLPTGIAADFVVVRLSLAVA